jgi:hypothetical protein
VELMSIGRESVLSASRLASSFDKTEEAEAHGAFIGVTEAVDIAKRCLLGVQVKIQRPPKQKDSIPRQILQRFGEINATRFEGQILTVQIGNLGGEIFVQLVMYNRSSLLLP